MPKYWLLKTEPESFSIQDLAKAPKQTTCWDGVRNYQARNYMRDEMKIGDRVLFYHSSADPPAVVGTARVVKAGYSDPTAWDPKNHHFDPAASPENPRWSMVDIKLEKIFKQPLSLESLRKEPALKKMELLRKGSRLSVQPVTQEEFDAVVELSKK
jgi:predicted RNA-binding protein with PUA-like domain